MAPVGQELSFNDEAPRQFMAPISYAEHDSHTRTELEAERDSLLAQLREHGHGIANQCRRRIIRHVSL